MKGNPQDATEYNKNECIGLQVRKKISGVKYERQKDRKYIKEQKKLETW